MRSTIKNTIGIEFNRGSMSALRSILSCGGLVEN